METRAQLVGRLLATLEDLTSQEALLIRSGDYHGVVQTQRRAAPVVECLASLSASAAATARARIAQVIRQRQGSEDWLETAIARARDELRQVRTSQRWLECVRPSSGSAADGGQRFSALG